MQLHRPILTQHRLQRLVLWALALASWISATLFANRPVSARRKQRFGDVSRFDLTRLVSTLIMIRALHMIGRIPRRTVAFYRMRDYGQPPSHFRRSLFGAKLRRALTHKDPATHFAQLIAVLRNLDTYAAHLARCMRGRRRRLWRLVPPIVPFAKLLSAPPLQPAFANSS